MILQHLQLYDWHRIHRICQYVMFIFCSAKLSYKPNCSASEFLSRPGPPQTGHRVFPGQRESKAQSFPHFCGPFTSGEKISPNLLAPYVSIVSMTSTYSGLNLSVDSEDQVVLDGGQVFFSLQKHGDRSDRDCQSNREQLKVCAFSQKQPNWINDDKCVFFVCTVCTAHISTVHKRCSSPFQTRAAHGYRCCASLHPCAAPQMPRQWQQYCWLTPPRYQMPLCTLSDNDRYHDRSHNLSN